MKKLFAAALLIAAILCTGCGGDKKQLIDNGETTYVDLPAGEKFVNFAHSRINGYVAHRKRRTSEEPEEYVIDLVHMDPFGHSEQISKVYVIREH